MKYKKQFAITGKKLHVKIEEAWNMIRLEKIYFFVKYFTFKKYIHN